MLQFTCTNAVDFTHSSGRKTHMELTAERVRAWAGATVEHAMCERAARPAAAGSVERLSDVDGAPKSGGFLCLGRDVVSARPWRPY